jgi:23S rRNA pseudouridine1911/1915/1917 synthase
VVLIAKRSAVQAALQRAADARRVDKDYLAVVWGKPSPVRGTIDLALDRDPWDRRKVTVTDRGGQPSVTRYERLAVSGNPKGLPPRASADTGGGNSSGLPDSRLGSGGGNPSGLPVSLVRCRLVTGRMHQIRVHLAAKGWPIVGDPTYGRRDAPLAFPRQALHAWRLAFTHPVTGAAVVITAPLPADMKGLCEGLGLRT